jgi:hypothetical protein
MTSSPRALMLLTLATGCHVFDPSLYATSNDGGSTLCHRTGPATLCPGPYLFCDGFESENGGAFPLWNGTIFGSSNGAPPDGASALEVATAPVCIGKHSLKAQAGGGTQQAFLYRMVDNRPNPLYVRFYFNVVQSAEPFQLLGFHSGSGQFATLFLDPRAATFTFSTNFSGASTVWNASPLVNRWVCLELVVHFDAANGELDLQLDGTSLRDVIGVATQPAGDVLDTINLGVISTDAASNGTNEVYLDEVALASAPIGCSAR